MNTVNIFTGAFSDEPGQRLLRILQDTCDNTFTEMHERSIQSMDRYRACLARVQSWDRSVISDEVQRLKVKFPDTEIVFRAVFVSYVKSMRASKTVRLVVNPPRLDQVLQRVFTHFSRHPAVDNAHYFSTPSVVEKRVICMDVVRDVLFDLSGEDHVKIVPGTPVRPGASGVNSTILPPKDEDQASRVVSNVCDSIRDDLDSIGPDDSVSCADFAEKQHRQLDKMRQASPVVEEDQESKTSLSLSLSSVSITEKGAVIKRPSSVASSTYSNGSSSHSAPKPSKVQQQQNSHLRKIDEQSEISSITEDASEASSIPPPPPERQERKESKERKSKRSKSYITSLTNDDSD